LDTWPLDRYSGTFPLASWTQGLGVTEEQTAYYDVISVEDPTTLTALASPITIGTNPPTNIHFKTCDDMSPCD